MLEKFFLVLLIVSACHFSIQYASISSGMDEIKRLSAENERLRSFNTRRQRRLKWMREPEKIDLEAVATASHILGPPPSLVAALIYCENGPQDIETGSIDKTDFFANNFPIQQWSTLDGTRTLNRMAWEWLLETPEGRVAVKKLFAYASKPYTNLSDQEQRTWAKNMMLAEARYRTSIKKNFEVIPTAYIMRTPTPTGGK